MIELSERYEEEMGLLDDYYEQVFSYLERERIKDRQRI